MRKIGNVPVSNCPIRYFMRVEIVKNEKRFSAVVGK